MQWISPQREREVFLKSQIIFDSLFVKSCYAVAVARRHRYYYHTVLMMFFEPRKHYSVTSPLRVSPCVESFRWGRSFRRKCTALSCREFAEVSEHLEIRDDGLCSTVNTLCMSTPLYIKYPITVQLSSVHFRQKLLPQRKLSASKRAHIQPITVPPLVPAEA